MTGFTVYEHSFPSRPNLLSFPLDIIARESKLNDMANDLELHFISFFTEEFAAAIALEGIKTEAKCTKRRTCW